MNDEKRTFRRESGIALMVVMVVFIILYLVVFQLHYSTRLEEKISRARSSDSLGASAIRSVSFSVLSLILEDLSNSGDASGGGGGAAGGLPDQGGGGRTAGATGCAAGDRARRGGSRRRG